MFRFDVLRRNRNYRNLFWAKVGSGFGDWFNQVAISEVTLQWTHSAAAMGLVLLCRSLPVVLLGPFVSPWVDRFRKRPQLFLSDLLRAVFALLYALAVIWKAEWILYANSVLLGFSGLVFSPARQAAIPQVVAQEDWVNVGALESGASGVLQIVGAASGGLVAAFMGPTFAFVVNAASYLASAVAIARSRWEEPERGRWAVSYFTSLRQGFDEAAHNKVVRAIILIGISWGFAGGGYYVVIPLLGSQIYHMGALGIGLLYAVDGIGVLVGADLVRRFTREHHRRAILWYGWAYIGQAIFFALLTQSPWLAAGAAMLLLMRIASGVIIPLDTYLLQSNTKEGIRGRVFALHGSTYGGVMQLSYALSGLAFVSWGIPHTGILIGLISLVCGVSWLAQFGRRTA